MRKTQSAPKPQGGTGWDEDVFGKLATKMDEYQNIMVACDSLTRAEENSEIRASCAARLKAMRREILDLMKLLQDQQK